MPRRSGRGLSPSRHLYYRCRLGLGKPNSFFCTDHASLVLPNEWPTPRTPAMAAGLTAHCCSVAELLSYQVPVARWTPPKQRGRRSKQMQELIARWAA